MIKTSLKKLYFRIREDYKIFCEFIDNKNDNEVMEESRLEIINLLKILPLPLICIVFLYIYSSDLFVSMGMASMGGFLITGMVFILIGWFMVMIHYEKKNLRKCDTP